MLETSESVETNQPEAPPSSGDDRPVPHQTGKSRRVGTAGYMSPEQIRGETLDERTDIFPFGLVLYEMATGDRAFSGDDETVRNDILRREVRPPRQLTPVLSRPVEGIIQRCLEKERHRRYASALELRAELERAREDMIGEWATQEMLVEALTLADERDLFSSSVLASRPSARARIG